MSSVVANAYPAAMVGELYGGWQISHGHSDLSK